MNCSHDSGLEQLAAALVEGARMELYLTPKPGLVDCADSGAHPDLTVGIMEQSIQRISECLRDIVCSLRKGEPFHCQKQIGMQAERHLLEDLGTNTHKGFIFLSSMLIIARSHSTSGDEQALRRALSSLASAFFSAGEESGTHGQLARMKYKVGGIVQEAIHGFPSLFDVALPAYRHAVQRHGNVRVASFAMLARLMQHVEDTTTLHRAGPTGLAQVKHDGQALEKLLDSGGDYLACLEETNRSYIRQNITMGGIADLLGIGYGYLLFCGEIEAGTSAA